MGKGLRPGAILTINAGSSSIKFARYDCANGEPARRPGLVGQIEGIGADAHLLARDAAGTVVADTRLPAATDHAAAFDAILPVLAAGRGETGTRRVAGNAAGEAAGNSTENSTGGTTVQSGRTDGGNIVAVGHRVVHGGEAWSRPALLDAATIAALAALCPLAPLHQPHNLAGVRALAARLPGVPQVACFDTAFHRSQPPLAQLFALPRAITAEGVRRYGFHGLSYEYIARCLPQHTPRADGRVIVAHLGNGASLCAMRERRSQATSMGFTAIDGLMMGTRSGALDPGVLLHLMRAHGMDAAALERLLYKESGLLGVSGISQDMRTLLASDDPRAAEAIDLFCYRAVREIGALAACIGGLDVLVFTGGIGEHAAEVRRRICAALGWLGIALDAAANADDALCISAAGAACETLVIPTDEEWMIARHTAELLA